MTASRSSRREFLKAAAASTALASLPFGAQAQSAPAWQNWSGNQKVTPAGVFYPASEADLVKVVKTAKGPLRAFGGGHSFSPVVPTQGSLISLEQMTGLIGHDPARLQATLGAGTRIAIAGEMLAAIGQNLENEPDINMQSLAGAISTATHGTGTRLKCLSGYVTQLKLVLADGTVVTCSKEKNSELFEAARVGVGCIGIISEITLQNRASYKLAETTTVMDFDAACDFVEERRDLDRHVEFFAFAHGGKAIVKQMNITTETDTPPVEETLDENTLLELAADTVYHAPFMKGIVQKLVGTFVSDSRRVGPAHRIFPNVRSVQFNEMEYTVAADNGIACLREVVEVIRKKDIGVFFPIEFRYTASDDTWLGMFSQRAGASISVHQYHRQDYRELFDAVEPVFRKYQGRPHWGKLHSLDAQALRALYPRWDDFLAVRKHADPTGRLLNPYMRTLLGVSA